ncbi:F-box only protein 21 [Formica fusca]
MSNDNLRKVNRKELITLLRFIPKHAITYYFVMSELCRNVFTDPLRLPGFNLSHEYNYHILRRCLQQYRLKYMIKRYVSKPKEKQFLEELLTIVAQYFRPQLSYTFINIWINNIVQEILNRLLISHGTHSIFSIFWSFEDLYIWSHNNTGNFWDETESMQIMDTIEKFIFSELDNHYLYKILLYVIRFYGLPTSRFSNVKYHCFRKYLLTVTYYAVARRLGIHCKLHPFFKPPYIVAIWKLNCDPEDSVAMALYVTDVCSKFYPSNIVKWNGIVDWNYLETNHKKKDSIMMTKELFDHYCRFMHSILMPPNISINFGELETLFKIITNAPVEISDIIKVSYKNAPMPPPKKRKRNIKFAVGMIVRHQNHIGIIVGWHYRCRPKTMYDAFLIDSMFPYLYQQRGSLLHICVHKCRKSHFMHNYRKSLFMDQPHYIILTHNNTLCYMPQSAISLCRPQQINNGEIGKYFSKFEGTHYVPNRGLSRKYPYDDAVIRKMLAKQ